MLSVFSLPDVTSKLLKIDSDSPLITAKQRSEKGLLETSLFGLGEQMDLRHIALRRSASIPPDPKILDRPEFLEPHRRGEVLVAAMMRAFLGLWMRRNEKLGDGGNGRLVREKVAEEGQAAADHLLTMAIRALDYAPSTDLLFGDYLSALLTADLQVQPDDTRYGYRKALRDSFARYGIVPAAKSAGVEPGTWEPPACDLDYRTTHLAALQQDPDEVFRFLWDNRHQFELDESAYTRVQSVRPCVRLSTDGFLLRETVAEYVQILNLEAAELPDYGLRQPEGMADSTPITLYGGGVLIFGDFGQLKYHVATRVRNKAKQQARLDYLWNSGFFALEAESPHRFAAMHRARLMGATLSPTRAEVRYADSF
jgi:hypothetical protein